MRAFMIATICLMLTACVYSPSKKSMSVIELDDPPTKGICKFIGEVQGESMYSFLAVGLEVAKSRAKLQAYELGATHIVWSEISSYLQPFVTGRAYRCD